MTSKVLAVFGMGIMELWVAVPTGFVMGMNPAVIGATAVVGATTGVVIIVLLGERIRAWFMRKYGIEDKKGRQGLTQRIWRRYALSGWDCWRRSSPGRRWGR